jgi:hypothetical protein
LIGSMMKIFYSNPIVILRDFEENNVEFPRFFII